MTERYTRDTYLVRDLRTLDRLSWSITDTLDCAVFAAFDDAAVLMDVEKEEDEGRVHPTTAGYLAAAQAPTTWAAVLSSLYDELGIARPGGVIGMILAEQEAGK